jgi:RND family efflux transporter MFP subunit
MTLILIMAATAADPVTVDSELLSDVQFYPRHTAPATVISLNNARLSAQINARVENITVREGQPVKTDEVLIQLDCRDSEQLLKQARAQWKFASDQFGRIKRLRANKNASEEAYSKSQFDLARAEVARSQAQLQVERCDITATFDGVILEKMVSEGDLAAPGTPLLHIVDLTNIEVDASVPHPLVDSLLTARELYFEQRGTRYPVELLRVTDYIDTISNDQKVYLKFTGNPPRTGAGGRLTWSDPTPHLPSRYIVQRGGNLGLFIVDQGKARFIKLPKALEGHSAPVDLPPKQVVITSGLAGLVDDTPVSTAP